MQILISFAMSTSGKLRSNSKDIKHSRQVCAATVSRAPDDVQEVRVVFLSCSAARRNSMTPARSAVFMRGNRVHHNEEAKRSPEWGRAPLDSLLTRVAR